MDARARNRHIIVDLGKRGVLILRMGCHLSSVLAGYTRRVVDAFLVSACDGDTAGSATHTTISTTHYKYFTAWVAARPFTSYTPT